MFIDRYVKNSGRVNWTTKDINEVINLSNYKHIGPEREGSARYGQIVDNDKTKENSSTSRTKVNGKEAASATQITPEALIRLLTFALNNEYLETTFPWLIMHRECWNFLRVAREAADQVLRQKHGPSYIEKETKLPFVVFVGS